MNFDSLIDRYSVEFEVLPKQSGRYVGGEYVESEKRTPVLKRGAIVSIPQRKIYQSGGYLTSKDLRLFIYSPLEGSDLMVRYKDSIYSVEDESDHQEFAGVTSYTLKFVSVFNKNRSELIEQTKPAFE